MHGGLISKVQPKKNTTKKTNEQKKWMKAYNELITWVRILTSWPQMALDMNFILKVYYFIDNLRSNKEPKLVNIFHYWSQDFFTPNSWLKPSLIKGPLTSNLTFSELNIATKSSLSKRY